MFSKQVLMLSLLSWGLLLKLFLKAAFSQKFGNSGCNLRSLIIYPIHWVRNGIGCRLFGNM
jgi:hypothetical protein